MTCSSGQGTLDSRVIHSTPTPVRNTHTVWQVTDLVTGLSAGLTGMRVESVLPGLPAPASSPGQPQQSSDATGSKAGKAGLPIAAIAGAAAGGLVAVLIGRLLSSSLSDLCLASAPPLLFSVHSMWSSRQAIDTVRGVPDAVKVAGVDGAGLGESCRPPTAC